MHMKAEAERRLAALGLDVSNYPLCFEEGSPAQLTEADRKNIADIEEKGHLVYLVTRDKMDDVVMSNYMAVTKYDEEWDYEFVSYADGQVVVYAYVMSVLTHGTFDYGSIELRYGNDSVKRCTFY